MKKDFLKKGPFTIVVLVFVIVLSMNHVLAIAPCSSGGLTTSVHNRFQMSYSNEDFIQINDIDLLKDISQLKGLTCLQYLDATDRTIKGDIANLKGLEHLEVFSLYSNPDVYGDICSLSGATNLRSLKFAFDPKITGNISCLKNLTKLESFAMTHTQIYGDLSVFTNMPNLKAIYVSGTNVSGDICSFSMLTNLEELGIADEYPGNPDITGDLSCLDNLQKLKRVSIYNTDTTNCEQFTKSHPNIAKMGPTESGRPAGGGCSEESLKTLVDVAQKYERKIGKEVQTEVRGKSNYNEQDQGPPEECIIEQEFIGEEACRAVVDRASRQDQRPPQECFVDEKFIGEEKCRSLVRGVSAQVSTDQGPPQECFVAGEFIGEERCRAMMEASEPSSSVGGTPAETEPRETSEVPETKNFLRRIIYWIVALFK